MNRLPTGLFLTAALTAAFLLGSMPIGEAQATPSTAVLFGMDSAGVSAQTAAGVAPDYGTFWIGPWTLTSGWGGPDGQLTAMNNAGVTPAIHFYYWGDDISPSAVENGVWSSLHNTQKDRAHWDLLATQLTDHLNAKMGGEPVVIFLESEFNKGGIETYEPFDGYMAAMADKIHAAYPSAIIVLGFGNWGSAYWGNYDRAAAASDMVGIQGMRGSTRQSQTDMMTLYDGLLSGVKSLETKFPGKAIMLTDIAVSSYPEPGYLAVQHDVLAEVFDNMAVLKSHGVKAIIYRSWLDSPNMDLANYYGMAERYWGLANTAGLKPSAQVWVDGVQAERSGSGPAPPPTPTPAPAIVVADGVTTQVESFTTKQAGGLQSDAAAQGGAMWNVWSNGAVAQSYNFTGSHDLAVRARGTLANGVAPHMDVYVAGAKVLSADPGSAYVDYRVAVEGTGIHEVRIAFTNDAKTTTEDRNLILDAVTLAPAAPPVPPNAAPTASFLASASDLTVAVDGRASSDPDGDALSYAWSFGDGAAATGPTANHGYTAAGTYTVTLTVSDGDLSASTSQAVTATQPNRAPLASFTATASNLTLAVDATGSTDADGDALSYAWTYGDGTTGTGRTASHAYASAGTYTVTLTIGDGVLSATATTSVVAVQPNRAPVAAFAASGSGLTASVDASASTDVDGNALTYAWTYGDGATGVGKTATHAYAAAGTYTIGLTVSDGKASASASKTLTVTKPAYAPTVTPKGNEWWVEASITGDRAVSKVEAKAGSGAYVVLPKQDWGSYAKSFNVPKGTLVQFRVTATDGSVATTAGQAWLVDMAAKTATPGSTTSTTTTTTSSSTTTSTAAFKATFKAKSVGNDWWVESAVSANQPVTKVEAKVGSGAWTTLPATSWGTYAKSMNAPNGSSVTFRATNAAGATSLSAATIWT